MGKKCGDWIGCKLLFLRMLWKVVEWGGNYENKGFLPKAVVGGI
jgi:hypothetical protein